jgi:hypothetical protein
LVLLLVGLEVLLTVVLNKVLTGSEETTTVSIVSALILGLVILEALLTILCFAILRIGKLRELLGGRGWQTGARHVITITVWVVSAVAAAFSIFPGVLTFSPITPALQKLLNVDFVNLLLAAFALLFALYWTHVQRALLSPFEGSFERIDREHSAKAYETTRVYVSEALEGIYRLTSAINNAVVQRVIPDSGFGRNPKKTKAMKQVYEFTGVDTLLHTNLAQLDKFRDHEDNFFKTVFVNVHKETYEAFMEPIAVLVVRGKAFVPVLASLPILEGSIRMEKLKALYATSIFDFTKFCGMYASSDISDFSKRRETQRIFVRRTVDIGNEFMADISGPLDSLPRGAGYRFSGDQPVPKLFAVLEWHLYNYWEMFCVDPGVAERLRSTEQTNGRYAPAGLDFLAGDLGDYGLALSLTGSRGFGRFFSENVECYEVHYEEFEGALQKSGANGDCVKFFRQLRLISSPVHLALQALSSTPTAVGYAVPDVSGQRVNLRDLLAEFSYRTACSGWVAAT